MNVTAILFAKPPVPGQAKTRLASVVGPERAAALASAFLLDTWEALADLPVRRVVSSTVADPRALGLPAEVEVWPQSPGDLGARMAEAASRALPHGPALCLGADSPGRPRARFQAALAALATHDAVLGPTEDGGYDLLGLTACPPDLLAGLPWSQPGTFEASLARFRERRLSVAVLERWWDVDEPADLDRLAAWLAEDPARAPRTSALLG